MNGRQAALQLRYLLGKQPWPGGTDFAFGAVLVSAAPERDAFEELAFPVAIISPMEGESDPRYREEPDLIQQRWDVLIAAAQEGDQLGQSVLVGDHYPNPTATIATSPTGRGLLELEEVVFDAIKLLNDGTGLDMHFIARSRIGAVLHEELGYVASRKMSFQALLTTTPFFQAPTNLVAAPLGGGSVTLTWKVPPDRFDLLRVALVEKAGSVAPTSITDGTRLTLAGDLVTSHTSAPGAGTVSYSVFGVYDGMRDANSEEVFFSAPLGRAGVVVT